MYDSSDGTVSFPETALSTLTNRATNGDIGEEELETMDRVCANFLRGMTREPLVESAEGMGSSSCSFPPLTFFPSLPCVWAELRELLEEMEQKNVVLRDEVADLKEQLREAKAKPRKRARDEGTDQVSDAQREILNAFPILIKFVSLADDRFPPLQGRITALEEEVSTLKDTSRRHRRDINSLFK